MTFYLKWKKFFDTSVLHCPEPSKRPDEFLIDETNAAFLKESLKKENSKNWYAHYHMGLVYYIEGRYKKAKKELEKSLSLAKNAWAFHALSCVCLMQNKTELASKYIVKGIKMRQSDHSYLKEGFKILSLCGANQALCEFYESMDVEKKEISRIRFYYIRALHHLGKDKKAYELLEQNGGLEMEDIREGEDSIAQLWSQLYQNLYGEKTQMPYKYNFKA